MTMPPTYSGRPTSKMSKDKKVLLGCGIGCVTIIALILIVIGFGGWWLFSSEDQAPTDRILNTGSSAAFRLEDISKNQELMQLISDVSKEAQRINQDHLPDLPIYIEKLKNYLEDQQGPTKFIKMIAPKEATASISSDEAGNPVFTVAANFGTGTRMAKMVLNSAFESNEDLKDKKISTEHGDIFLLDPDNDWNGDKAQQLILGFYKGTFIVSNNTKTALSALDQLAEESYTGKLKETLSDPFYHQSQKGSVAYGVLDGSLLKKTNYTIEPFQKELVFEMKKAEISVDELSGENGILNLRIDWNNKDVAAKANEVIEKLKPEWINKAEQNGFKMDIMNSLKYERLDIQFRVNNLKASLIYLISGHDGSL